MKKYVFCLAFGLIFWCLAGALGLALLPHEVLLGTRTVEFRTDHDEIVVTMVRGRFAKLRLQVNGNDLEMFDMKVYFGNGQVQDIVTKLIFREGERSRIIDLAGSRRDIRKVVFYYRTIGALLEGKAVIQLFGIR